MMEPRFERARVLAEAIDIAARELKNPIDRIQVSGNTITMRAGGERVDLSFAYYNAYTPDGSAMPGSGHWSVSLIQGSGSRGLASLVRRLFARAPAKDN